MSATPKQVKKNLIILTNTKNVLLKKKTTTTRQYMLGKQDENVYLKMY